MAHGILPEETHRRAREGDKVMSAMMQNTPEWVEMRRNHIGASDAPIIMGLNPWKTPYQLWQDKMGISKEIPISARMQRGHDLEEIARQEFERQTGLIVFPQVVYHPKYEWMIASLDGIDLSSRHIVEIKCPGARDHAEALEGHVPDKYVPQLQHQMEVVGVSKAYYFSFDGLAGKFIEVYRDDAYSKKMIAKEQQFWECMKSFQAPDLSDRDYTQREDELWIEASTRWRECYSKLQEIEREENSLRESLIALSGGSSCRGANIRLSKIVRRGSVDYKAIPELQGVEVDKYRKGPVECWRLAPYGV